MVSLIIPALNEVKVLPQAFHGLTPELKNRYQLELIVSDGGSTDGTIALARQLGARVVEADGAVKQTIALGRNCGAAAAQGDVFVFLDADCQPADWSTFLARVEETMREPGIVAATVRVEINSVERQWWDSLWMAIFNCQFAFQNYLGFGMGRGNCQIVKAAAFHKVGGYDDHLAAAEDYDLYRRLRRLGRIRFLWDVVVYESPRRYRRLGYLRVAGWWFLNALSVVLRRRSFSREWKRVR